MTPTGSVGSTDLAESGDNLFKVKSSWFCATENGLANTLVVRKDSGTDDIDPTSLISVETCVLLRRDNNDEDQSQVATGNIVEDNKCTITLEATGNTPISSLSVLSEARMIEVHGLQDEYLKTVRGEFMLVTDDTHVYCADIKLEHPTTYLSLTLNRLSRGTDLWIYGVVVNWKDGSGVLQSNPSFENGLQHASFNRDAIDRRLSQLGQDLSINAQQCKQFLEMCSLRSSGARGDGQMIKPPLTSLLANMLQGSQKKDHVTPQQPNFESLLDQKLLQLEKRLLAAINQSVEEMEKRQEALINDSIGKIMHHLQSISGQIKENSV